MIVNLICTGSALALAAHLLSQIHEPPLVLSLRLHFVAFVLLSAFLWRHEGLPLWRSLLGSIVFSLFYLVSLVASLVVYRLYLHRLRLFPGETIHKLTMFSWLPIDWKGTRASHIQSLHARHGLIVRTGPRQVSVADPRAITAIYGSKGACWHRGPWSMGQASTPRLALATTGKAQNDGSRKSWDAALSVNSLEWQGVINGCVEKLINRLREGEASVDISDLIAMSALDCWAELVLGKDLGLLAGGEVPPLLELIDERLRMLNTVANVPYCMEAVLLLPSSTREFEAWTADAVDIRADRTSAGKRDGVAVVDQLLEGDRRAQIREVVDEATLVVLHGSDTTRSTLTWCLSELLLQPQLATQLQAEIDDVFGNKAVKDLNRLQHQCPFLNACLNETLRLWPAVPSGPQRRTAGHGLSIDSLNVLLPGNVHVSVPSYTLQRDPANFSTPNSFRPSRWLDAESTADCHNTDAFHPFGFSTTSNLTSEMAMMQCRLFLARLYQSFHVGTPMGTSLEAFRGSYRDQHTIAKGPLSVTLQPR